jgi:hypothetical protein
MHLGSYHIITLPHYSSYGVSPPTYSTISLIIYHFFLWNDLFNISIYLSTHQQPQSPPHQRSYACIRRTQLTFLIILNHPPQSTIHVYNSASMTSLGAPPSSSPSSSPSPTFLPPLLLSLLSVLLLLSFPLLSSSSSLPWLSWLPSYTPHIITISSIGPVPTFIHTY